MYIKDSKDTYKLNAWCADKKALHKYDSVNLIKLQ